MKPLARNARYAPNIHGEDGLGGVVGIPQPESTETQIRFARHEDGSTISALEGMATAIRETWKSGAGHKVSVVSSGPMTNIALFISTHPELLEAVEQFVFMGGGIGLGNVTPVAGVLICSARGDSRFDLHLPQSSMSCVTVSLMRS